MSPDPTNELPSVTFGEIKETSPPDWRDEPDAELSHQALVAILGFDPDEVDDEGNDLSEAPK
jgi:hypothetical protein